MPSRPFLSDQPRPRHPCAMEALEKLELADCRDTFGAFVSRIDIPGAPSPFASERERFTAPARELPAHHVAWCRLGDRLLSGDVEAAMVFAPPGSAKSTIFSQLLPAFAMGKQSGFRCISTSYGTSLARKHSRRARGVARQPGFARIFNAHVPRDMAANTEWRLDNDSEMLAAGLLAGVVGNRANLASFDDPFKGRAEARSPTIRLKVREALEDDLFTRLVPGGAILGVFTRYVMDDAAAWFLGPDWDGQSGFWKGIDGRRWFVLNTPYLAEREDDPLGRAIGERIWPERFGPDFHLPFMKSARTWASLYQQRPAPTAGLIFKREWLRIAEPGEAPRVARRVRHWDTAATEEGEGGGDFTAGVKIAESGGRYWIEDVVRGRWSAAGVDAIMTQTAKMDGPGVVQGIDQDPGQAGKDQAKRRAAMLTRAGSTDVRVSVVTGSKVVRADKLSSEAEQGNVALVKGPWNRAFIDELADFPLGQHDDQVDAASRACNELGARATLGRINTR